MIAPRGVPRAAGLGLGLGLDIRVLAGLRGLEGLMRSCTRPVIADLPGPALTVLPPKPVSASRPLPAPVETPEPPLLPLVP